MQTKVATRDKVPKTNLDREVIFLVISENPHLKPGAGNNDTTFVDQQQVFSVINNYVPFKQVLYANTDEGITTFS